MQASAKVQYLIGRTHLLANVLGFQVNATDTPQRRELHQELQGTLNELKETYFTLLYGGLLKTQVCTDLQQEVDGDSCLKIAKVTEAAAWLSIADLASP